MATNNREGNKNENKRGGGVGGARCALGCIVAILFVAEAMVFTREQMMTMATREALAAAAATAAAYASYPPPPSATGGGGSTTLLDYELALLKLEKYDDMNWTSHVMCPKDDEIGWRQPADMVPRLIGNKCEPWWTRDVIFVLEHIIKADWTAVEWGAGSSTVWMATHAGNITTIEDDGKWVDILAARFRQYGFGHVELRARPRQTVAEGGTMHSASRGCCYDNYVRGASDIPDGTRDMIIVDGRARELCLKEAVRLVKPVGGIVLLDNSNRKRYQESIEENIPKHWVRHDTIRPKKSPLTENQVHWITRDDINTTFWITREL